MAPAAVAPAGHEAKRRSIAQQPPATSAALAGYVSIRAKPTTSEATGRESVSGVVTRSNRTHGSAAATRGVHDTVQRVAGPVKSRGVGKERAGMDATVNQSRQL